MTPNISLVVVAAGLVGSGVYLLLARSVIRALIGFVLMSNGVNILFLIASGPAGQVPIIGEGDGGPVADPIPQALVLTAIVITLGMTAFVLSLAHRAWQNGRNDLVADDPESARIHLKAETNDMSDSDSAREDAEAIELEFAGEDEGEPR